MDAEADAHVAVGNGEQWPVGAGQRAAVERDTEGTGRGVGCFRDPDHTGETRPSSAAALAHLNTVKSPAIPRTFSLFALRGAGDIIGDHD